MYVSSSRSSAGCSIPGITYTRYTSRLTAVGIGNGAIVDIVQQQQPDATHTIISYSSSSLGATWYSVLCTATPL